jgi:hypothetical protein
VLGSDWHRIDPFRPAPDHPAVPPRKLSPADRLRRRAGVLTEAMLARGDGAASNPSLAQWLIGLVLLACFFLPLGWFAAPVLLAIVLFAAGTFGGSHLRLGSLLGSTANDPPVQRKAWTASYSADYLTLLQSGLPQLIAEDEMWTELLTSGIVNTAKYIYPPPKTSSDRLIYATAFWEVILAYARGERRDFSEQLIARRPVVQQLQSNDRALHGTYNCAWLARFTALHDFFFGPQD